MSSRRQTLGARQPEATSTPAAGEPVGPRRLVIGQTASEAQIAEDELLVGSLGELLEDRTLRAMLAEVDVIELRYNGMRDEPPLRLPRGVDLVIRGGYGFRPGLRFAPPLESAASLPSSMIHVDGGRLALEWLDLEFDVPKLDGADRWSLVQLGGEDRLRMADCTMTIRAAGEGRESFEAGLASFIEIDSDSALPPPAAAGSGSGEAMPKVVPIVLENCIARGEATLLRMPQSVRVDFAWTNGLLVSSERLLLAGGSRDPSVEENQGYIRLTLTNVTAVVDRGLCLLRDSRAYPYQPPLELTCERCVIVADEAAALVEHLGVGSREQYSSRLFPQGSRNFYQDIEVYWRVNAEGQEVESWDWAQWKSRLNRNQSGMPSYHGPVRWAQEIDRLASVPTHGHTTADYALEVDDSNPAMNSDAGFLADDLPNLPPPASGRRAGAGGSCVGDWSGQVG